jgi:hypothetical protein
LRSGASVKKRYDLMMILIGHTLLRGWGSDNYIEKCQRFHPIKSETRLTGTPLQHGCYAMRMVKQRSTVENTHSGKRGRHSHMVWSRPRAMNLVECIALVSIYHMNQERQVVRHSARIIFSSIRARRCRWAYYPIFCRIVLNEAW